MAAVIGVKALDGIDLAIEAGTRLAIIGRNGSRKTTLLRILAGLLPPDHGEVVTSGRLTNLININLGLRRQVSGHRNVTLLGLAAGRTRQEIEARREDIAQFSELGEFLDLPVSAYSSGMQMRLSFAIATAFQSEILILDEWLSTGDAAFTEKATQRMQEFVDSAGILALASHSGKLLRDNCNRAIWMQHGRIEMGGDVDDVLSAYERAHH